MILSEVLPVQATLREKAGFPKGERLPERMVELTGAEVYSKRVDKWRWCYMEQKSQADQRIEVGIAKWQREDGEWDHKDSLKRDPMKT